jgi:hypothetical protein
MLFWWCAACARASSGEARVCEREGEGDHTTRMIPPRLLPAQQRLQKRWRREWVSGTESCPCGLDGKAHHGSIGSYLCST